MAQQQNIGSASAMSSGAAFYIETSVPAGWTIADYRRSRPPRPTTWRRLKELAGGAAVSPAMAR